MVKNFETPTKRRQGRALRAVRIAAGFGSAAATTVGPRADMHPTKAAFAPSSRSAPRSTHRRLEFRSRSLSIRRPTAKPNSEERRRWWSVRRLGLPPPSDWSAREPLLAIALPLPPRGWAMSASTYLKHERAINALAPHACRQYAAIFGVSEAWLASGILPSGLGPGSTSRWIKPSKIPPCSPHCGCRCSVWMPKRWMRSRTSFRPDALG